MCKLHTLFLIRRIRKKKKKKLTGPIFIWGLSMLGGLRSWPKWPRPKADPNIQAETKISLS